MAEVTVDKLAKLFKGNSELTQGQAAQKLGVTVGQVPMTDFCKAKVQAGVVSTAPATTASVKKLRDSEGNRWELISARTGVGVAKVKELYGGEEAAKASYSGRGRNFNGTTSTRKSGSTKTAATKTGGAGRKASASKTKTGAARKSAGRKAAGAGRKSAAAKTSIVRNRGGRQSTANPS